MDFELMRFGCCCGVDWIGFAEADGFDFVELPVAATQPELLESDWDVTRKQILNHSIRPEAWNMLMPRDMPIVGPDVDWNRITGYLNTVFDRVSQVNGKIVVFGSGASRTVPDGFSFETARKQVRDFLVFAGSHALEHSLTLTIEPLNKSESNIINSIGEASDYATEANNPAICVVADVFHMAQENEPVGEIEKSARHIKHIHVADTGRLYPGSGDYSFTALFTALKRIGYNARISIECGWGSDRRSEQQKALQFLRLLQT